MVFLEVLSAQDKLKPCCCHFLNINLRKTRLLLWNARNVQSKTDTYSLVWGQIEKLQSAMTAEPSFELLTDLMLS